MKNNSMNFVKGLGAGMIAGATVMVVGNVMLKDKHNVTKGSTKVIKAAGDFVDGIQTMFR